MNYFYFLYATLLFYIFLFFKNLRQTLKFSSYITLYKSCEYLNKPFIVSISNIIFTLITIPIATSLIIYFNFRNLSSLIENSIENAGYYLNMHAQDWLYLIFKNEIGLLNITNPDLLFTISEELSTFRIQAAILIISALIFQTKIFDKHEIVVFEDSIMQKGVLYKWEDINFVNAIEEDTSTIEYILSRFSKKGYIYFEMETTNIKSLFDFFKKNDQSFSDNSKSSSKFEKIKFKIPKSELLDFKCAIRMINIKSNLY